MSKKKLSVENVREKLPWGYAEKINAILEQNNQKTFHESHIRRVLRIADDENRIISTPIWNTALILLNEHESNFVQNHNINRTNTVNPVDYDLNFDVQESDILNCLNNLKISNRKIQEMSISKNKELNEIFNEININIIEALTRYNLIEKQNFLLNSRIKVFEYLALMTGLKEKIEEKEYLDLKNTMNDLSRMLLKLIVNNQIG